MIITDNKTMSSDQFMKNWLGWTLTTYIGSAATMSWINDYHQIYVVILILSLDIYLSYLIGRGIKVTPSGSGQWDFKKQLLTNYLWIVIPVLLGLSEISVTLIESYILSMLFSTGLGGCFVLLALCDNTNASRASSTFMVERRKEQFISFVLIVAISSLIHIAMVLIQYWIAISAGDEFGWVSILFAILLSVPYIFKKCLEEALAEWVSGETDFLSKLEKITCERMQRLVGGESIT